MSDVLEFCTTFLGYLPTFLMSEPICYIVGFVFVCFALKVIKDIVHL